MMISGGAVPPVVGTVVVADTPVPVLLVEAPPVMPVALPVVPVAPVAGFIEPDIDELEEEMMRAQNV